VEQHFAGQTGLERIFGRLLAELGQMVSLRTDAIRSGINLAGKYHFAMVFVRKDHLLLEFVLARETEERRIRRTDKLGANYVHRVRLDRPEDIDAQLLGWLNEAYNL
jgi:hypothetical protein